MQRSLLSVGQFSRRCYPASSDVQETLDACPWRPVMVAKLCIVFVQTVAGVIAVGTSHGLALVFGESKLVNL